MKKILFIALLIIPFYGISQTTIPIDGFLGIKFGSSKLVVIAAMKAKGAVVEKDAPQSVVFNKVKLGNRKAEGLIVKFVDNKAYSAMFAFTPEEQPKSVDYYHGLVNDISEKYGPGKSTNEFKSPFEAGDGHEMLAIQGGYATIFTDWQSGDHSIQAAIDHDGDDITVSLVYTDETLQAIVDAKQKAKQKSDF